MYQTTAKTVVGTKTELMEYPTRKLESRCMLDLEFSLTKLAKQWNSGSHVTRSQRLYALCSIARTLVKDLPYKALADANHLKPKTQIYLRLEPDRA